VAIRFGALDKASVSTLNCRPNEFDELGVVRETSCAFRFGNWRLSVPRCFGCRNVDLFELLIDRFRGIVKAILLSADPICLNIPYTCQRRS
jgi:hypothetical protein